MVALVGDISALLGVLDTADAGADPVLVMSPARAARAKALAPEIADMIISAPGVAATRIIGLDAATFVGFGPDAEVDDRERGDAAFRRQ